MKKWRLLSVTALSLLLLTGCQNPGNTETTTTDSENHTEQQVTSLTQADDTSVEHFDDSEESTDTSHDSDEFYGDTLDSLEEAVSEIIQKIDNASASGSDNERRDNFIQLSSELQEVENQLDYYDENTENDFEQGKLSYDEAREIEFKVEKLEDQLDNAEDTLEYKFGYDD